MTLIQWTDELSKVHCVHEIAEIVDETRFGGPRVIPDLIRDPWCKEIAGQARNDEKPPAMTFIRLRV